MYICENFRVKVYDKDLNFKYSFGDTEKTLSSPVDIANDSKNGLYITDDKKNAVVKFQWSETGPPSFQQNIGCNVLQQPSSVTVDSHNYIYVIDERRTIFFFQHAGEFVKEIASGFSWAPRAMCCANKTSGCSVLYVADCVSDVNVWKCNIQYS